MVSRGNVTATFTLNRTAMMTADAIDISGTGGGRDVNEYVLLVRNGTDQPWEHGVTVSGSVTEDGDDRAAHRFDETVIGEQFTLVLTEHTPPSGCLDACDVPIAECQLFGAFVPADGDDSEATGPVANLTVAPSTATVRPGGEVDLTYALANTGTEDGNATSVVLEAMPSNWSVSTASDDWRANSRSWVSLQPVTTGGQYQVTASVTVPDQTSEGQSTVTATGNVAPGISDDATATVNVAEGFSPSRYDTTGDGTVEGDISGVLQAIADYNDGNHGLQQALQVIAAYNGG
jgi:hypothetical protein